MPDDDEEVTDVRDLPLQVRAWAARQSERMKQLRADHTALHDEVKAMKPILEALHIDASATRKTTTIIAWLVGVAIAGGTMYATFMAARH
jgi:hypothetical protein